jgi:hypothetical protein
MPTANKQRFLRIQASHDPWSVGLRRSYGTDFNNLTINWRASSNIEPHPQTTRRLYSNELLVDFQHRLVKANKQPDQGVRVLTVLTYLDGPFKAMHDALLAVRELVFEDVRRKEFSDLPSRHTCLYLCPDRPESVRYWWQGIATQGPDPHRKIFEVEATGNRFLAPDMVTLQTMSVEEWESLARRYWSPHDAGSVSDEILFAGDIEVIAERDRFEFGII